MDLSGKIIMYAILPVATMLTGGIVALVKKPGGSVRSLVLHFAAGVIFSVVAAEIIPDVVREHAPFMTTIGFISGFVVMAGIRHITEGKIQQSAESAVSIPWGLLTGIATDIFIDGLLLGIGFAAGNTEGVLLAIALSVELLSLGMATATELMNNKLSRKRSATFIAALAGVFFISAILGATLLQHLPHSALEIVLSFGLSALLFLVTEELLIEAHEEKETIWHTSAFFIGFLAFMMLGMYT